jgi:tryptophan-rich sensory protein
MMAHRSARLVALALWMALCVGGGALIGVTTQGDSAWYASLEKPSWTPPGLARNASVGRQNQPPGNL